MRPSIAVGICLAAFCTAAHADPFIDYYDNTAVSTMQGGEKMLYYVNRDGTFESHFADGSVVKGHYDLTDAQTACFLPTEPAPPAGTKPVCRHYPVTHHVGDVWTETANGASVTDTLVTGRDNSPSGRLEGKAPSAAR